MISKIRLFKIKSTALPPSKTLYEDNNQECVIVFSKKHKYNARFRDYFKNQQNYCIDIYSYLHHQNKTFFYFYNGNR